MSDSKFNALKELISTPKDLNKLLLYEKNLRQAFLLLLFDCRTILQNNLKAGGLASNITRLLNQLKVRIDSLIDRVRYDVLRFRPGTSEKIRKSTTKNCLLYDLIIFSRSWDLKEALQEFDAMVIFNEDARLFAKAKTILKHLTTLDELLVNKESIKTNVQSPEVVGTTLYEKFNRELELAENAGALRGIIKLEKPKLLGRSKYYEQLGNLLLKVVFSFSTEHSADSISLTALTTRFNETYPYVQAELSDIIKATETLAENGFFSLRKDARNVYWLSLKPAESVANVILALAEKRDGQLTMEEVVQETNFSLEEVKEELDKFVKSGCAIKDDDYSTGIIYYFPGFSDK